MIKRAVALLAVAGAAAVMPPAAASASNVIPGTYTGTATTGGTMEFDVSPDGAEIVRFALTKVSLPPCGTITGQTPRKVAIVADSFSNSLGLLHFSGSFLANGQAQGTISYHRREGLCDSQDVSWTATAPAPPPVVPAPEPPSAPAPPTPDETSPQTQIEFGPSGLNHTRRATFRFSADEVGAAFSCKLDGGAWQACESAQRYRGLKDGRHVFRVKAVDLSGNVDGTPAKRSWRVALG